MGYFLPLLSTFTPLKGGRGHYGKHFSDEQVGLLNLVWLLLV